MKLHFAIKSKFWLILTLLISLTLTELHAQKATWIWYPGDC